MISLGERGIRGVVLDIEGTTTPIAFVYEVLFPYARAHLRDFLEAHRESEALDEVVHGLRAERLAEMVGGESPPEIGETRGNELGAIAAYVEWLMDRDRKSPPLKLLQGMIWERGYTDGTLKGEVFPDVPDALARCHSNGVEIAIYSSGSALAQRLLFKTTKFGDLTRYIGHYFDTAVGSKRSAESYEHIAKALKRPPANLLFISDLSAELDAASSTGWETILCVRPGNNAEISRGREVILSFDEIVA
jgi:enolase-phosphatase E1